MSTGPILPLHDDVGEVLDTLGTINAAIAQARAQMLVKPSRELALAITKLEEALHWCQHLLS